MKKNHRRCNDGICDYQLHQIINESRHVIENPWFCTDLIFTSQPNLVVDSSVHPSLHPNYHHQI